MAMFDHSLRTPLNTIFQHSDLILMGFEGEKYPSGSETAMSRSAVAWEILWNQPDPTH